MNLVKPGDHLVTHVNANPAVWFHALLFHVNNIRMKSVLSQSLNNTKLVTTTNPNAASKTAANVPNLKNVKMFTEICASYQLALLVTNLTMVLLWTNVSLNTNVFVILNAQPYQKRNAMNAALSPLQQMNADVQLNMFASANLKNVNMNRQLTKLAINSSKTMTSVSIASVTTIKKSLVSTIVITANRK
jgi:hypothetical protein